MTIKTFRGKIADQGIDTIVLHTNDGSTGYRIVKFDVMTGDAVGSKEGASLIAIYKTPQATALETADFNNQTLLATADYRQHTNEAYGVSTNAIIFDSEIFNQDIYITNKTAAPASGNAMNYYIELEQVKLDLSENTVATLKDIRNITAPT